MLSVMAARIARGVVWFSCIIIALLGCGEKTERDGDALRKVRVASNPHLSWGPLMIAQAEGFFREEGLDVEFVQALEMEEGLVALIKGDIDVRPGPPHAAFFSAIARGAPIKIVAGSGVLERGSCTYFGIVLRPGLDTAGTPDIRRLRTSQDGSTRYVVSRMLAERGMSLDRIETNRVEDVFLPMSLENGSLDAAAVTEPALTRVAKSGTLWLSAQDALPGYQWSVLAFSERLLVRERDTGLRFLRAYHRAVAQYREGKTDRNVAMLAQGTDETPEHTREACWPTFSADSRVNWSSIDEFQRWAMSEGFMERTVTEEQALDSTFVAATAPTSK
jgi:NitT/TauT family transport system substrate-binding protein